MTEIQQKYFLLVNSTSPLSTLEHCHMTRDNTGCYDQFGET